jgi:hypothetical protein
VAPLEGRQKVAHAILRRRFFIRTELDYDRFWRGGLLLHFPIRVSSSAGGVLDRDGELCKVILNEFGTRCFDLGDHTIDSEKSGDLDPDVELP